MTFDPTGMLELASAGISSVHCSALDRAQAVFEISGPS